MKVTREVIVDLWPVYESGAASPDTRTLVEEFLGDDPEFARSIREGEGTMKELLSAVPVMPPPDAERASLARAQLLLRLRFDCLAAATALALLATILRQYRVLSVSLAVLSATAWVGLSVLTRGRRLTSLAPATGAMPFERWRLASASVCVSSALFAVIVHSFREYSLPLAIVAAIAWAGLEIASRARRPRT